MWIRPEIQDDFSPEDIIEEAMGDYVLEFLLAVEFDDRQRAAQAHLMSVMLIDGGSFIGDLDGIYDLRFGIREKQVGNEFIVGEPDFSRARSRRCIHRNDRGRVLDLVCSAVRMLLEHVEPAGVTMTTYDRYLPMKAISEVSKDMPDAGGPGVRALPRLHRSRRAEPLVPHALACRYR
ncbi:hypothetical protein DRB17_15190 [Ferruginivarius sediminum]|uniref:Uncharacterized protein n=1 Tax=Ferruginivarius sediminum TaxID=2661937 RepID=A0A369T9K9_9PROT|nr:hypothetical protein DRB17_15190 [Ferruginivarius sediminum]